MDTPAVSPPLIYSSPYHPTYPPPSSRSCSIFPDNVDPYLPSQSFSRLVSIDPFFTFSASFIRSFYSISLFINLCIVSSKDSNISDSFLPSILDRINALRKNYIDLVNYTDAVYKEVRVDKNEETGELFVENDQKNGIINFSVFLAIRLTPLIMDSQEILKDIQKAPRQ